MAYFADILLNVARPKGKRRFQNLKKKLILEGLIEDCCAKCGWNEHYGDSEFSGCELHHKDGNPMNNSLTNLELLCPNCHRMTDNYGGRNVRVRQPTPLQSIADVGSDSIGNLVSIETFFHVEKCGKIRGLRLPNGNLVSMETFFPIGTSYFEFIQTATKLTYNALFTSTASNCFVEAASASKMDVGINRLTALETHCNGLRDAFKRLFPGIGGVACSLTLEDVSEAQDRETRQAYYTKILTYESINRGYTPFAIQILNEVENFLTSSDN